MTSGKVVLRCVAGMSLALLFAGAGAAPAQNVSIELSLAKEAYRQGEPLLLTYTVHNHEARAVSVLKWNTPLEGGLIGDPFVVRLDGAERRFFGVMAERRAPGELDWATIPPNGTATATVDLAQGYDLSAAGAYEVSLRYGLQHVTFDQAPKLELRKLRPRKVPANTVRFRMEDAGTPHAAEPPPARDAGVPGRALDLTYAGCQAPQEASLQTAFTAMVAESAKVDTFGQQLSCGNWSASAPITTFIGKTCTQANVDRVRSVVTQVHTFAGGQVIVDCTGTNSCVPGPSPCGVPDPRGTLEAFTCAGGFNRTIYVCPTAFFKMGVEGNLPSQQGTLYHELTHWAFTRDYAYGCQGCANLANSDEAQAIENADNYTYLGAFVSTGNKVTCGLGGVALTGLLAMAVQAYGRRRFARKARENAGG